MADEKQPSVEQVKREIAWAAIERENLIVVRNIGGTSVHVGDTPFTGLPGYVAWDAVQEMIRDGEAEQSPFNGSGKAYKLTPKGMKRFTKDISG